METPELDVNLAEFVGVLLGDGSIGRYECRAGEKIKIQHRVKITGDATEDLPYFKECLSPLMTGLFGREPLLRFKRKERTVELAFFGKGVYEFLINFGMAPSPKRNRAVIPPFIFENNLEAPFLRGLFDTDGCLVFDKQHKDVHYYPRIEIKMLPCPMRDQLFDILSSLHFRYIVSPQPNESLRIQMNGKKMINKWDTIVGFNNKKHISKYQLWQRFGYYTPNTTLEQRLDILSGVEQSGVLVGRI
ncbi:MAG: hypothetical protein B6U72_05405 [Candidatus Altiarchaeales archaeon ex4484_2]|nr:MAG: hypothetical protein B6U72_05405 [Candidatus Altiarchaeales archaeon ex4484_2]